MNRKLIPVLFVVAAAGLIWAAIAGLETKPTERDEAAAVILRAPAGFEVEGLGEKELAAAASALASRTGSRVGVEFVNGGDRVILLADRDRDELTELRAAGTGTIVERTWPGPVGERLAWASAHGNLEVPGMAPATGKNLYH